MFVQDIEKTVGETPQEEEDGDQTHGDDGLTRGDLGGASDLFVVDTFPVLFALSDGLNGRGSTLIVDVRDGGFCFLPEHVG